MYSSGVDLPGALPCSSHRCTASIRVSPSSPAPAARQQHYWSVSLAAGLTVAGGGLQLLQRGGECEVLPQAVPPQVTLIQQLLNMLGGRAARPGLQQPPAGQQRHCAE